MSGRKGERGAVLVAVLMVLALLSLLGAGSMLSASLDTQATGNQRESRLSFYAAEAALDYAVDQIVKSGRDPADPASVLPFGKYEADGAVHPVGAIPGLAGNISDQYDLSYTVGLLPGQTDPVEVNWSTTENAQALLNYARGYIVTGIATNVDDTTAKEEVRETVRILRRPLSQYLAFYEGDMNWRPQTAAATVGGGRIHASGSIYLAPVNDLYFSKQDSWGGPSVFAMTAGAEIRLNEELQEGGSVSTTASVTVTLPDGNLSDDVQPSNQATQEEAHMILVGGRPRDSYIRVGVDAMRSMKETALGYPNGFYSRIASGALEPEPGTDCIHISGDPPVITLTYWEAPLSSPPSTETVDGLIYAYERDVGQKVKFLDNATDPDSKWTLDALGNADGSLANDAAPPILGTIVYGFDSPPAWDEVDPMPKYGAGDYNPDYPTTLGAAGVQDPREGKEVRFTVVDLQRLECWYRDYLIENNIVTPAQFGARKLLVYATRTAGMNPLQAVKVIGSLPGRWRRPLNGKTSANRQLNETALVPTTFVTDLPLYIEGDFSSSSVNSPSGKPIAVVADSVTVLSNSWGINHHPDTAASVGTWETAYSAAFFAGRHDPAGGGSGPAEGVENLLRLAENWSGLDLYVTGSLNSLWYSTWAASEFDETAFGAPAVYRIGWNPQFGDLTPEETPPYVPSVFMVERESWQEH